MNVCSPSFFRRMAVIGYDALLLLALLFVATGLLLPLNEGEAFSATQHFFLIYLFFVSFIFYGWFWTHGGQTLGMRAWKIKVQTLNQQPITWKQAFKRFFMALISWLCFGLGFFWQFFDKQQRTWHDHFSETRLFFE